MAQLIERTKGQTTPSKPLVPDRNLQVDMRLTITRASTKVMKRYTVIQTLKVFIRERPMPSTNKMLLMPSRQETRVAFTLNERETKEVFAEAKRHNIVMMEAMWTQFFPLRQKLRQLVYVNKTIGGGHRVWYDFGLPKDIVSLPMTLRYKNPALGVGSLLEI
ncbi:dimeric dihydrodiol dehydrogenase [Penicillium manginii]|uniref:dimeric dihydrodiol dehydrogenase n=1 Tax=Penicillium manginii TaxID=203109 RepID=UPI002547EE3D|nr:dimeric dihydrodiol dehydrogenase [Penicillium manginii]KAJ5739685.1 dimeric dihydrodiol dehydrogenase [Penicillium manginii]